MGKRAKGGSDDLQMIQVIDFSGGLNTMNGPLSLGLNECLLGTQNVIGFPGRGLYCGGFQSVSTMPSRAPDAAYEFFDVSGQKHRMVWDSGQLYEVTSGTAAAVTGGTYIAGEAVGRTDRNGILFWCTRTVPVNQFDGATNSTIANAPTGTYMTSFAGSLIVANPTPAGSSYQPGAFIPSNVNLNTFNTANMQQVGTDYGGIISFILPMGVSSSGIPPSKSILVGKTIGNLFLYTGPVGNQSEAIVNCASGGCLDANSAVYIPAPTELGGVIFLGADSQLWFCDGVTATLLTDSNLDLMSSLIADAKGANPNQRFTAAYNRRRAYYVMDIGDNTQIVWRWKTKALYRLSGWPSGAYFEGVGSNGFNTNYVAAGPNYTAGVYQLGVDYASFNGTAPAIRWVTPYFHGGNAELGKDFQWLSLFRRNLGFSYKIKGQGMPLPDNSVQVSNTLTFFDPAYGTVAAAGTGIWDQSDWDEVNWGDSPNLAQQNYPVINHGRIGVPVPQSKWVPFPGVEQALRSGAISITVEWNNTGTTAPGFDICGIQARYNPRSMMTQGGNQYTSESGTIITGYDPFMGEPT